MVSGTGRAGGGCGKKLIALGQHWAGAGSGGKNELEGDAAILGISLPDEYFAPPECECWPEHWEALQVFLDCATQWRMIAGHSQLIYQGLDYSALESLMRMRGVSDMPGTFHCVRLIERGALECINAT